MRPLAWLKRIPRNRWFRRVLAGIAGISVLGVLYIAVDRERMRSAGSRELAQVVAETDQSDPDWRWDALNKSRKRLPEGKNSAEVIDRVRQASPRSWFFPEIPDSDPPNHKDSDEAIAAIRKQLAEAPSAVQLARSLRDYPSGYREVVASPSNPFSADVEGTQHTRWAGAVLNWDSRIALADKKWPLVCDNLIACLNASRSIGDEPDSISQLVRAAARAIATRMLERALARSEALPRLAELQAAWVADAEEPLLYHVLRGNRALYDLIFERLENGTLDLEDFIEKKDGWMGRTRSGLPANRASILRQMTAFVEAAKLPAELQGAAFARNPWPDRPPNQLMAALQFLSTNLSDSHWRSTGWMRCAVAGIACERFRLLNGRWPKTLQEIPTDLLAAVPLDPFDEKPLRYRQLEDGVAVYSIGINRIDDGGDLRWSHELGLDVGFRLWNPSARGLAPLPPVPKAAEAP